MTRFRALTLTAVLAGLLAGGVAVAQGPGPGRRGPGRPFGPGPGGPGGLPLQALNLTDTERDQIRQLMQQLRQQNQSVGEQLRTAMDAQRTAVETMPVDEGLIRSTTQALVEAPNRHGDPAGEAPERDLRAADAGSAGAGQEAPGRAQPTRATTATGTTGAEGPAVTAVEKLGPRSAQKAIR